jgi:antitoxin component of MazEF toxin-antitoxin module
MFKYIYNISFIYHMEIRLKLRKIGDSIVITMPSQVVSDLKLKSGDKMMLDLKDSTIVIRKEAKGKR